MSVDAAIIEAREKRGALQIARPEQLFGRLRGNGPRRFPSQYH